MLEIAGIRAGKGSKKIGFFTVSNRTGESVDIPIVLINGVTSGPTLLVSAGIHGAGYPGIEAAIRFAREVVPQQLRGGLIILPVVNTEAFFD